MGQFFTTAEVARTSGATKYQLSYWCRKGWIPDMPPDVGYGRDREWTPKGVAEARRLARASDHFSPTNLDLPRLADFLDRAAEAGVKP